LKKFIVKIMTCEMWMNVKKKKQKRRSICTHVHVVTIGQRIPDVNRKSEILNRKTHGFVNIVYNRKRQRSAILHKIVVSLADFSWLPILCMVLCNAPLHIGVNAARVAGVTTPQYLTCRGRPVLTNLNILTSVLFFPFCGTSEYRKSLSFSSAMRPVYSF